MLQLQLFCIYDTKVENYFPPFAAANASEALRSFSDLLSDSQSRLSKHPGDYRLFRVGEFHADTGVVLPLHAGVQLVESGLDLVKEA